MDRFIGKALLEVHKDKQSMPKPSMTVMQASDHNRNDIRHRVVLKQETTKKIINLKELAQSRQTSKLSLTKMLKPDKLTDFKLKLPRGLTLFLPLFTGKPSQERIRKDQGPLSS